MRHSRFAYITIMCMAFALASCVKHELYDTEHPDSGALVVTADFSNRPAEASVPESYIISLSSGDAATVHGETNVFDKLLAPGSYTMLVYNTPEGMTVNGTVATVNSVTSAVRGSEIEIEPQPEYLFGAYRQIAITEDDTTYVEVTMRQYVKLLKITLNVKEGDSDRIASASCTLSGVETSVDLSTGILSGSSACTTDGLDIGDGTMTTFFRILGIVPTEKQILTVKITYDNGDEETIESDISDIIADINGDDDDPNGGGGNNGGGSGGNGNGGGSNVTPTIDISGDITLPTEAGFSATIDGWTQATGDGMTAK